jgi:hypothetical protein
MTRIATEQAHLSIRRERKGRAPSRVRFCALDGTVRVIIETDHTDDAHCLCREMRIEFICFCED